MLKPEFKGVSMTHPENYAFLSYLLLSSTKWQSTPVCYQNAIVNHKPDKMRIYNETKHPIHCFLAIQQS